MTRGEHKHLGRILGGRDALVGVIAWWKSKAPKRKPKPLYRKAKEAKQLVKKGVRADVRAACVARAQGWCECGCLRVLNHEMDHFYGRAFSESAATCWMLAAACHKRKTENNPSRVYWDKLFAVHCAKYGYPFRPRLTKSLPPASPTVPPNPPGIGTSNLAGGFTQDEPRAAPPEAPAAPKGNSP